MNLGLIAGEQHYQVVVNAVMNACCSVWIATANLKAMMVKGTRTTLQAKMSRRPGAYASVLETFDRLARRGVELRILHASLPSRPFRDSFDRFPRLFEGGLDLRLCPRLHMKVVIIDGELLYLGSANWTGAGLGGKSARRRNFELGIVSRDSLLLDQVQGIYDGIWRGEECGRCGRRDLCEAPLDSGDPI